MELGLSSNAALNPSVCWTTLLPPLFSGLAVQPGVRTIAPPPLAWGTVAGIWSGGLRRSWRGSDTRRADCLALDPFAFEEDGLSAPEVDVSWGKIVEALVIAGVVVMRHEGRDLAFEIAGQVVVLKQDAVLERLMPALDLALGLRMIRGAADMLHLLAIQPLCEILRDI